MLKWGGTAACLSILCAFIFSTQRAVQWVSPTDTYAVMLHFGAVAFLWKPPSYRCPDFVGWYVAHYSGTLDLRDCFGWPAINQSMSVLEVWLPLWIPFVLVAVPTAFLWWRDRHRIPPGRCQKCGYNLTGNVSGVCPECGTPTPRSTA